MLAVLKTTRMNISLSPISIEKLVKKKKKKKKKRWEGIPPTLYEEFTGGMK